MVGFEKAMPHTPKKRSEKSRAPLPPYHIQCETDTNKQQNGLPGLLIMCLIYYSVVGIAMTCLILAGQRVYFHEYFI